MGEQPSPEAPPKTSSPGLFFPPSDSEGEDSSYTPARATVAPKAARSSENSANTRPKPIKRGSSSQIQSDVVEISDDDDDIAIVKAPSSSSGAASRKRSRRGSQSRDQNHVPTAVIPSGFKSGFLGEFVCEGWSLSKGRGYCSSGTKIIIERNKPKDSDAAESSKKPKGGETDTGRVRLVGGKVVGGKAKPKQTTLASTMNKKAGLPNRAKAATDQIIRFRNERGFEVGRLSVTEANFLTHLLDTGIIKLGGHVIDCPEVLTTGCTILLNIKVHLTRKAFQNFNKYERTEQGTFWKDQQETVVEEAMRFRKDSLAKLFERIGVKPIQTNALSRVPQINGGGVSDEPKAKKVKAISDAKDISKGRERDTGEDSGDEAEVLNDKQLNEIDNIYRKAQQGDTRLDEMDPPETFLYTLRPYQKQALTWMNARERGDQSVREESLHPLWEEYLFRKELQPGEPIEISDDEVGPDPSRKFYWNPYSGELALQFPTSKNLSRGGILADAMGMGKTCMMASLIHTNRETEDLAKEQGAEKQEEEEVEPASKRTKFKQVTLSNQWRAIPSVSKPSPRARATLVVCPVSLAAQWHEELGKMSKEGSINSFMWYGNDRTDIETLLSGEGKDKVDVIVTSYGTVSSEYQRWVKMKDKTNYEGGSLYDHDFLRIVLDEAHNIKNRTAMVSRACYELQGQRRWALTGTPIVNRLEDLYSLLHFLRITPWGEYSFFRSFVTVPFLSQDPKALNVVQYILETCLLRREKTMRDKDGRLIVDLPPKHVAVKVLEFSRPERQIYKFLEERAKKKIIELDADGRALANYTSILAMLMKLRQCVDHPLLVLGKSGEDSELAEQILDSSSADLTDSLRNMIAAYAGGARAETPEDVDQAYAAQVLKELGEQEETPICELCSNEMFDEVLLPCYHRSCQDCIVEWIGTCEDQDKPANCPTCDKGPIKLADLRSVQRRHKRVNPITGAHPDEDGKASTSGSTAISLGKVDLVASTKLKALARRLAEVRQEDPTYKALVFSQFTSFLDLIETTLTKQGVKWLRFDGSMSQAQRAGTVTEFGKKSAEPVVMLISLKAGGVGLNLTMANHVFMMDTWWNEATEQQAVDRCHRLGQTKPVYVTRYIIKGTVEKRIMKIQRSKTALVNASLRGDAAKSKETSLADIKKIFGLLDGEEDSEEEIY
ncbi:DNA repair protein RAD5 [Cryptococcus amylolentus CBS 6273]|uniref:DNA repair protein RAD5 n=1 Tax=Cryptococcus amylolentus CBS 6273 TaxID=1296118 RepID=A0A1E3K9F3_9TREE|nr:DNA repair protein RAD5 [Cryptococcus amylolentus CBS 6273]